MLNAHYYTTVFTMHMHYRIQFPFQVMRRHRLDAIFHTHINIAGMKIATRLPKILHCCLVLTETDTNSRDCKIYSSTINDERSNEKKKR